MLNTLTTIRGLSVVFILFLLSASLSAQIKIKEQIKIGAYKEVKGDRPNALVEEATSGKDYFIVPKNGTIRVSYYLYSYADSPLQINPRIKVTVGGKEYNYTCFNLYYSHYTIYCYYNPGYFNAYESADTNFITVHKNDTLRAYIYSIEDYVVEDGTDGQYIGGDAGGIETTCPCGHGLTQTYGCYSPPETFHFWCEYLPEIMLGESKYLQAAWWEEEQEVGWATDYYGNPLRSTPNHNADPVLPGKVEFTVESVYGNKPGVYWDQFDESGNQLPSDMIRILGRYWDTDTTYIIKVKARYNGKETIDAYDPISVQPPVRLGDTYNSTVDVFGNSLDVDSMIITIAGREGIPPQYIKGQMYQESYHGKNEELKRFYPSYRYEPAIDYDIQNDKDKKKQYLRYGYPFVVTLEPNNMGGILPTNHKNVKPYDYQRDPVTISRYIGSRIDEYYQRDKNNSNRIKFLGKKIGAELTLWWETYYDIYRRYFFDFSNSLASNLALASTKTDLIQGGVMPSYNVAAQTRIVASYGLLQMTHYTATDKKLNGYLKTAANKLPENLNDQHELMPAYIELTRYNIKRVLGDSPTLSNWNGGYEGNWLKIAGWYNPLSKPARYNAEYGKGVINNSKLFLPQR